MIVAWLVSDQANHNHLLVKGSSSFELAVAESILLHLKGLLLLPLHKLANRLYSINLYTFSLELVHTCDAVPGWYGGVDVVFKDSKSR